MDALKPKGLTYPEGLDEAKTSESIQTILDGIDRERLFEDRRMTRVRHPLLAERIGRDVALNTEIHNLLADIALELYVSNNTDNSGIHIIEDILLSAAKDPKTFRANLAAFKDAVIQLSKSNSDGDGLEISGLVSNLLRQKLKMPNLAQEFILYPTVTISSLGESNEDALKTLEGCREQFLDAFGGKNGDDTEALKEAVEAEAAAVKAWFEDAKNELSSREQMEDDVDGLLLPALIHGLVTVEGPIDERDMKRARRLLKVTATKEALSKVFPGGVTDELWNQAQKRRSWAEAILRGELPQ